MRKLTQSLAVLNSHPEMRLLEAAAQLSDATAELSPADAWRLPDLCNFFSALNISEVDAGDMLSAVASDTSKTRNEWIRCAAVAVGLNLAVVAAQARLAIREVSASPDLHHLLALLLTSPVGEMPQLDPERISDRQYTILIDLLSAHSDWIASTACQMLRHSRDDQLQRELLTALPGLPARRRSPAAYLASYASMNPVQTAAKLLSQTDPATRVGATRLLAHIRSPSSRVQALLAEASHDQDLTIRVASHQPHNTQPAATTWSCRICADYNDLANNKCSHCHLQTRPLLEDED